MCHIDRNIFLKEVGFTYIYLKRFILFPVPSIVCTATFFESKKRTKSPPSCLQTNILLIQFVWKSRWLLGVFLRKIWQATRTVSCVDACTLWMRVHGLQWRQTTCFSPFYTDNKSQSVRPLCMTSYGTGKETFLWFKLKPYGGVQHPPGKQVAMFPCRN